MRDQRSFSLEFKRQAVEELLSGETRPAQLCRRCNISSSLLYHWKSQYGRGKFNNEPTEEAALQDRIEKLERLEAEADLRDQIEAICLEFPRYGYRRVTYQLKHEGRQVNHKKVLRLMRESDLLCRVKRRWVRTTDSRHHFPRYPNLIKGMVISQLNQAWLADITYIRIRIGFVYLAAILDAFSRKVIGYAVSRSLDTTLTLEALRMAIVERQPGPGVIHHSDQGVQYASGEYVEELKSHGFEISMARKGSAYENAVMES